MEEEEYDDDFFSREYCSSTVFTALYFVLPYFVVVSHSMIVIDITSQKSTSNKRGNDENIQYITKTFRRHADHHVQNASFFLLLVLVLSLFSDVYGRTGEKTKMETGCVSRLFFQQNEKKKTKTNTKKKQLPHENMRNVLLFFGCCWGLDLSINNKQKIQRST